MKFKSNFYWKPATLIHLPNNVYGCFNAVSAELSSCGREYIACKAENTYYLHLEERKNLSPVGLELLEPSFVVTQRNRLQNSQAQGKWSQDMRVLIQVGLKILQL